MSINRSNAWQAQPIAVLELSYRSHNALCHSNINTLEQLIYLVRHRTLKEIKGVGEKTEAEILQKLHVYLLKFPDVNVESLLAPVQQIDLGERESIVWHTHPIEVLKLNIRSYNALKRSGINTLGQLALLLQSGVIRDLRNIGKISEAEIMQKLTSYVSNLPDVNPKQISELAQEEIATSTDDKTDTGPAWHYYPTWVLNLAPRLSRLLERQEYSTLGRVAELCKYSDPREIGLFGLGPKHLADLKKALGDYLATLPPSAFALQSSPIGELPSTLLPVPPRSLPDCIREWLNSPQKKHSREVIYWRYGIESEPLTLEEVGQQLGVTRERVRQIEKRAIKHLARASQQEGWMNELMELLQKTFADASGVLTSEEMESAMAPNTPSGLRPLGLCALFAEISDKFGHDSTTDVWVWGKLHISEIHRQIKQLLKLMPYISETELLTQLQKACPGFEPSFLQTCLKMHPDLEITEDGIVTFKKWSRHRKAVIISALRQIGHPAHYTEITEVANQMLPSDMQVEPHNIHAQLQRMSDTFVWVESGTYGLAEWGLERSKFYVDIIKRIFKECGHPLSIQETLTQVCAVRDCKESTVTMLLTFNEQFRKFPGDVYGLAEWHEDEFPDATYREKRLLAEIANDDLLQRRKPKLKVAQTLQDIDDLLGMARSENRIAELPLFYGEKQ